MASLKEKKTFNLQLQIDQVQFFGKEFGHWKHLHIVKKAGKTKWQVKAPAIIAEIWYTCRGHPAPWKGI